MSTESVYTVNGAIAITHEFAGGPWDPRLQHGGAPASLIAWAAERIETSAPMQIVRLTVDLMRPVPIAPLEIRSRVIRNGRKIQLCEIGLFADGVETVRGTVLKVRQARLDLPREGLEAPLDVPGPDEGKEPGFRFNNSFVTGLTLRVVKGAFREPGPAAMWFRAHRPIVTGEPITPVMRAAMTSDFCNGLSAVLDFTKWTFINGDLTVSLARAPVGEWILLNAESWIGPDGAGIAFARLGDERGYFGRAIQSLVIEPR